MSGLFEFDREYGAVCGCDEAGRGPIAGGVFAAAVYFKDLEKAKGLLIGLNDSKKLSEGKREELFEGIVQCATFSISYCSVEQIGKMNILNASLHAMNNAVARVLKLCGEDLLVLVDGNKKLKDFKGRQNYVIKGDSKSASIAAASILAKVARDRYMNRLAKKFPAYFWDKNKGYLTAEHKEAILVEGLTPYHREKFVRGVFVEQMKLF